MARRDAFNRHAILEFKAFNWIALGLVGWLQSVCEPIDDVLVAIVEKMHLQHRC